MANLLMSSSDKESPLDSSSGTDTKVSNFLTLQSLTNFGAMTGALSVAWLALQGLDKWFAATWIPYAFAAVWAVISLVMSWDGFKKEKAGTKKLDLGSVLGAIFIAVINALVLASAVVGATSAGTGGSQ